VIPESVKVFLKKGRKIFVATHIHPDGDALGSLIAFYTFLKSLGKEVEIGIGEKFSLPSHYSLLPHLDKIKWGEELKEKDFDSFVSLDAASPERLGVYKKFLSLPNHINIDHHVSNTKFATLNWVDSSFSSTCEMIYELIENVGVFINKEIALPLYVGILTDTGRFQYPNTTPKTFEVAKKLIEKGVDPYNVYQNVYESTSFSSFRLLGKVIERTKKRDGLLYSYITLNDLNEFGISLSETENFVDFLRSVKDAKLIVLFKELPDGRLKVSLRSRGSVSSHLLAQIFGGGGHKGAAGFVTALSQEDVLEKIAKVMKEKYGRILSNRQA
jgi:phosphoesterase RecJ-like protein